MSAKRAVSSAEAKALLAALLPAGIVPTGTVGRQSVPRVGTRTLDAIHRRALVTFDGGAGVYRITDAGRAALATIDGSAK